MLIPCLPFDWEATLTLRWLLHTSSLSITGTSLLELSKDEVILRSLQVLSQQPLVYQYCLWNTAVTSFPNSKSSFLGETVHQSLALGEKTLWVTLFFFSRCLPCFFFLCCCFCNWNSLMYLKSFFSPVKHLLVGSCALSEKLASFQTVRPDTLTQPSTMGVGEDPGMGV